MDADKPQEIITGNIQPASVQLIITQGVVQNLPEIIGAIKEIYTLHKKEAVFRQVLHSRLDELNINKENFKVLVVSLTELSKTENADSETKTMYRDMIKTLFEMFANSARNSQDISDYLKEF